MKLRFDDDVETFRAEFVEWLAANRPSEEEIAADPQCSSAHLPAWAGRWTRRMFDAGWLVPGWPPERGGRNAGAVQTLVYLEELAKAGVPRTTNPQGLGIIAPSILDYGTEQQIADYALPILRGERSACLGMSEPDAGSDLANLKTRAVRDGDHFVVSGQKVWTSGAAYADFCFLFCRTDAEAPKHKGISILLLEMDSPGVTVRPLTEIIRPEFPDLAEVFLDDVEVPADRLVGDLNDGWRMAGGSLAHERGMVWLGSVLALETAMAAVLEMTPSATKDLSVQERAVAVDDVVRLHVDTQAARCLGYRGFARLVKGGTAPEQALMKVYSSEIRQRLGLVAAELNRTTSLDRRMETQRRTEGVGRLEDYFATFSLTISAGSSEIQRNIIAERILGLPRS